MHGIARDTIVDGRYRAERRLGSGGMAEVWCAEDDVLGRRVALKLLGSRFAEDDDFRERFKREAQAAAGLAHPHIVGIFDRGEWDGTPYIAMELVEGRTLKDLVRERGPLPPDVAINLTIQVLGALGFAHRRGIVHRDVKPQNVILDHEGLAKVADFGIARSGGSEMTETGTILGTVQYASPEQAQGQPVSPRSDLYSAGVVLYELLTGRVPFEGESVVAVALKQVSELPVPPSQLRPGISPALEAVVLRALEKDPARRFASADEFIAALEAARRAPARPVRLEPAPGEPWVAEEAEEPGSRWWLWLLALLVVAGVALGAYLLTAGRQVDVPRVVGMTAGEAAHALHRDQLEAAYRSEVSQTVPRNQVMRQNPGAGAHVDRHSTVLLTVSAGRGSAPVPRVEGLAVADAKAALRKAGFNVKVRHAYSDSVPKGTVVSSSPQAGTSLGRGRTVTLTVSRGPRPISLPKLTGLPKSDAEQKLSLLGLKSQESEKESAQTAGTVLAQDPAAGTTLQRGDTVRLTVAKARPQVPDVSTQHPSVDDATKTLTDAGFKVRTREQASAAVPEGNVVRQFPEPGTQRSSGATVTLVVSTGSPTPSPTPSPTDTATPTETPTP
jgi:eukaryotic-like serine/threonine-protein kinase